MRYAFPPDVQQLVDERLATGHYGSEDDVQRDALKTLKGRDSEIAAIAEGIADMEAGRFRSLEAIDVELRRRRGFPEKA